MPVDEGYQPLAVAGQTDDFDRGEPLPLSETSASVLKGQGDPLLDNSAAVDPNSISLQSE